MSDLLIGRSGWADRLAGRAAATAVPGAAVAAGVFVAVAGTAAADGGYYPTAWGWLTLAFAGIAAVAVLGRDRITWPARERLFVALLAALTVWMLASSAWSSSVPSTVAEVERALVYVTGVTALLLVARARSVTLVLGGVLAAIAFVAAYSLATRLFPDRMPAPSLISGYRLSEPLGYWNGLGLFAGMGTLLALGLAARARTALGRAAAASTLALLLPTVYFTFSRGAWVALAAGLLTVLVADPRRVQLATAALATFPLPLVGVAVASQSRGLTRLDAELAAATDDGRTLALLLVVLAAGAAAAAYGLAIAEQHYEPPAHVRRGWGATLAVAAGVLLLLVFARYGSPDDIARRAYDGFKQPPPVIRSNLNERLFSFSNAGRISEWNVALDQWREAPVTGTGAGTYEQHWLRDRERGSKVRDAHSLYLEVLGELGVVGLALLAAALAIPLSAGVRSRHHRIFPAAFGAYVAYVVHAGVDWDWEIPAVTMPALACGCALLVARRRAPGRPPAMRARAGAAAVLVAVALAGVVVTLGNNAIEDAGEAVRTEQWAVAAERAREARRWAPWSPEPLRRLGQVQVARGRYAAAERNLRAAIAKDPRNWELWFDLALATLPPAQIAAMDRALELNPLSPELQEYEREVVAARRKSAKSS